MPSLINQVPPGLLSLLGIKALGVNPSILPDELSASLELLPLYLNGNAQEIRFVTAVLNAAGLFFSTAQTVPPGEIWLVEQYSIELTGVVAAATTYRLKPVFYNVQTFNTYAVGPAASAVAGDRLVTGSEAPFYMAANHRFAVYVEQLTLGTAQTCAVAARVLKLTV